MPSLLAYCPTCKRSFGANNIFGVAPGAVARNITFQNVGVTCPLGHHGFFLDGTFDLMGNSQRLVAGLWVSQKVTRTARQLLGTTTTRLRDFGKLHTTMKCYRLRRSCTRRTYGQAAWPEIEATPIGVTQCGGKPSDIRFSIRWTDI
jgi:hypothetical protein